MSSSQSPLHHAAGAVVSDAPIDRVIFDSLSPRDRERLRGATIFDRLIAQGISEQLAELKRAREAQRGRNVGNRPERFGAQTIAVLAILCTRFGRILDDEQLDGLMVFATREELASAITGSWKSTYPLIRQLEAVGAVESIPRWGPYQDVFYIPCPSPTAEEARCAGKILRKRKSG